MKKTLFLTLSTLLLSMAAFALTPILGTPSTCVGSTSYLHDTTIGGTWSSSNPSIATVGSSSGIVTGISGGTVTITYTLGTAVTTTFTVSGTLPAPITGTTTFCIGTTSTLADATPGGVWSSTSPGVASVGSGTGVVTGSGTGSSYIYYTIGGCSVSATVTVDPPTSVFITGPITVCLGSAITLSDSTSSTGTGTWSSGSTAVATITSSGVVTGMSAGTATISYTLSGACGTSVATYIITVTTTTSTGTISGSATVAMGATTSLYDAVSGGAWSSSNTAIATVNATTGDVTGVSAGTATITYTVSGCGGSAYTTAPISVTTFGGISGHVLFTGTPYSGNVKVWLITYNPATYDLEAVDSVSMYCSGSSSLYYQFLTAATDSFRIKAAIDDTISYLSTGYIPTYHTSSFYWYTANVLAHTSGIGDINQDITMSVGTITSGPGFIGGNVTTGANKGTGTPAAVGLSMYLINSTSGAMIQQTKTDASGNYTFTSLPVGATYYVHPEAAGYLTTPYTSITLTTTASSMAAASFVQHTKSHTITPVTEAVNKMGAAISSAFIFPNPSTGKMSLQWNVNATEKATVIVTDMAGRELYTTTIDMKQGSGTSILDLSALTNGYYTISVKSASINYNNKIQVAH